MSASRPRGGPSAPVEPSSSPAPVAASCRPDAAASVSRWRPLRGLRARTILPVLATLLLILGLRTWELVREQRRARDALLVHATDFLAALAGSTAPFLADDAVPELDTHLSSVPLTAARRPEELDIVYIAALDPAGGVRSHTPLATLFEVVWHDPFYRRCGPNPGPRHRLVPDPEAPGEELLEVAAPIRSGVCWGTLVGAVSRTRQMAALSRRRRLALATITLLGALLLFALLGLGRTVLAPIERIGAGVRALAGGALAVRVPVHGDDELADLGRAVNRMAGQLEERTRHLEGLVADRTRKLQHLADRLAEEARTDPLTGARNRRFLEELLAFELTHRRERSPRPLSVIMLDVDHFKDYNDTFLHQAGDEVLVQLVETLRARLRSTDAVIRYGGEEFAVLMLDTPKEAAATVAEELRLAVAGHSFPHRSVTVSLGVAAFPEDADRADALLRAADVAMYAAKEAGRNRVEVSA